MGQTGSHSRESSLGRTLLLRGESQVAMTGLTLALILLLVLAGCGWWSVSTIRRALNDARFNQIVSAVESMAESSITFIEMNELSNLRRVLLDAGLNHELAEYRIVLPDGSVVVHKDATRITAAELPENWPAGEPASRLILRDDEGVRIVYPLEIHGRPGARLEVRADYQSGAWSMEDMLIGVGAIGAMALLGVLLVYRNMRERARTMSVIRDALIELDSGGKSATLLSMPSGMGEVATAWNRFIAEMERLQKQAMSQRVGEVLATQAGDCGDVGAACDMLWHGLVLIDSTQIVTYANGAAAVYLNHDRDRIVGRPIRELIRHEALLDCIHQATAGALRTWTSIEVDEHELEFSGVIRFNVRTVRQGDKTSAAIIIEDITQQRVAAESRNSFVAQVTHELRSPLTNIRLYADNAIESRGDDAVSIEKALNVINQESRRLERIVGDMLSVAEIEAGKYKLRRDDIRLDGLFEELEIDYAATARDKGVTLQFDLSPKLPVVQGDRDKIALAAHNLLANAIKYTPQGGRVTVSAEADEQRFTMEVSDTGIGIEDDEREKVFEKFYRANDTRVADITGSGLGLALARDVMRMHGGDITLESELNEGSTFTMSMPIMVAAAA